MLSECEPPPREEEGGKEPLAEEGAAVECDAEVSGLADGGCPGTAGFLLESLGGDGRRPLRAWPLPPALVPGEPMPVAVVRLPPLALAVTPLAAFEPPLAPKDVLALLGPCSPAWGPALKPALAPGVPGPRSSIAERSRSPRSEGSRSRSRWEALGPGLELG